MGLCIYPIMRTQTYFLGLHSEEVGTLEVSAPVSTLGDIG